MADLRKGTRGREAGDTKLAFSTGSATGGIVGGAINASRAAAHRDRKDRPKAPQGPTGPSAGTTGGSSRGEAAMPKKLPMGQRVAESKVGQAVQSESFRSGAKRVGGEVLCDAAAQAAQAKQSGSSAKGVAASAARGLRTEMANREAQRSTTEKSAPSAGSDLVGRMGEAVGKPSPGDRSSSSQAARPLSERYDYQFEEPQQPGGGEQQLDG